MSDDELFSIDEVLPEALFNELCQLRVESPELVVTEARERKRRPRLAHRGRLLILAADHPGRGVTGVRDSPVRMGDRREYLARIVRILTVPGVDGVMATPDILEELLLLNSLLRMRGIELLSEKLMIGSMNRGGLASTAFEMRDRFGAIDADQIQRMGYDGAKLMFRLDPEDPDSGRTIFDCAEALRGLERNNLPAFLEPLPVRRQETGYKVLKTADAMIATIGIATALANSSRYLWLKIPYVDEYARVAAATTCPILMLGGPAGGDAVSVLEGFALGMRAAPNVRGALVGRNILFPPDEADPTAMAEALAAIVHNSDTAREAARFLG